MGAPLDRNRKRGVAVLASGVVISLTALTAGVVPAVAQPDSDDVVTTVAPKPDVSEPKTEVTVERPASAPERQGPTTRVPPQTQAPVVEPEPAQQPEPVAQQPEPEPVAPPKTSVSVQVPEPVTPTVAAPTAEPSARVEPAPATSATPDDADAAPPTTREDGESAEPATTSSAPVTESSVRSTTASAPATDSTTPTPTSGEKPSDEPSDTAAPETTERSAEASDNPTVSIEHAAAEIETLAPETLEAPAEDVQLARNAKPVFEPEPAPAPEQDIAAFKESVDLTLGRNGNEAAAGAKVELEAKRDRDFQLVSNVRQWRPEWVEYDEYYRPVLMNPFRDPVRIVYVYDMRPRIVYIPPLSRMVLQAAQFAAYSFTAAVLSPVAIAANLAQAATNIAVGSFFGGGYFPGAGLPLPPPPPPVLRYDNVPVLVNYSNARYEPFRVRQIVDVGEDRVYGGHKVLLDGATPAWGEWTQNASGERQFEVHRTQQFPGLSEPAEGPLPGDYRLRLASDEASAGGLTGRDIFLMVAAGVIGTLGFGAIGLAFFLGRRRPEY